MSEQVRSATHRSLSAQARAQPAPAGRRGDAPAGGTYSEAPNNENEDISFVVRVHPSLQTHFCSLWNAQLSEDGTISFTLSRKELFLSRLFDYSGFVAIIEPRDIADEIENVFTTLRNTLVGKK